MSVAFSISFFSFTGFRWFNFKFIHIWPCVQSLKRMFSFTDQSFSFPVLKCWADKWHQNQSSLQSPSVWSGQNISSRGLEIQPWLILLLLQSFAFSSIETRRPCYKFGLPNFFFDWMFQWSAGKWWNITDGSLVETIKLRTAVISMLLHFFNCIELNWNKWKLYCEDSRSGTKVCHTYMKRSRPVSFVNVAKIDKKPSEDKRN